MRRALVLTNEAARHPFRQSLPAHLFTIAPEAPKGPARARTAAQSTVMNFSAGFAGVLTFIS